MSREDEALRQWCVEKSIAWCTSSNNSSDTTDDMIEIAGRIELYVTTGKSYRFICEGEVDAALCDAECCTSGVARPNAKKVCDHVREWLKIPTA